MNFFRLEVGCRGSREDGTKSGETARKYANASTNEVFPDPVFDTTATFLMDSVGGMFIMTSSSEPAASVGPG